ncbi:hypothetical protein ACQP1K_29050 (plasmid) [Sphaerimonospora sp. CA-214678]|uniref:hypothetical protein n=1 Tax=Sphaerimonospora sp. CA-214678 TaxID=3240029 RepID=UPI003D914B7F
MEAKGTEINHLQLKINVTIDGRRLKRALQLCVKGLRVLALMGAGHLFAVWWWL